MATRDKYGSRRKSSTERSSVYGLLEGVCSNIKCFFEGYLERDCILSHEEITRLGNHKYAASDNSILVNLFFRNFWDWLIGFFPLCYKIAPRYTYLIAAIGLFLYQTLDALDGKQARRTQSSSPLGELFDHGCDSMTQVFVTLNICYALQLGEYFSLVFITNLISVVLFYCAQWQTYCTGVMKFGKFDVTEAQWTVISILLLTAFFGPQIWTYHIFGLPLKFYCICSSSFLAIIQFLGYMKGVFTEGVGKNGSTVAGTSVLFPVCPLLAACVPFWMVYFKSTTGVFEDNITLFVLCFGAVGAKATNRLVIAHMSKSELENSEIHDNIESNDLSTSHVKVLKVEWHHVNSPYLIGLWLILTSLAKVMFSRSKRLTEIFPESALLIVVGLIVGHLLNLYNVEADSFKLESTVFFLYLLPPIIFDAGYCMPNRELFENIGSVTLFAIMGTIFNTILISTSLYVCGQFDFFSVKFTFVEICLFAALISAVDPVAVIAIFEEIHINELLFTNLFCEALFNDGVTVVIYQVFKQFHSIGVNNLNGTDFILGGLSFPVIALGGVLIVKLRVLQPVFIFTFPYLSYLTAEMFGLSSILAIVACGIVMKQYIKENISQTVESSVKYITKILAQNSEAVIFLFLGLSTLSNMHHWDTVFVILTIIFCSLYRVIGVVLQCTILNKFRKKQFTKVDQFVLSFSGLRGAIAYGLATSLPDNIPAKGVFLSCAIAVIYFTVFFQGIAIKPLLLWLKVEKAENRSLTMLETVYGKYFDFTITGIEDIAGQKGINSLRDFYERFNARILKPALVKGQNKTKIDVSKIIRAYYKISYNEALELVKPAIIQSSDIKKNEENNEEVNKESRTSFVKFTNNLQPLSSSQGDESFQKKDEKTPVSILQVPTPLSTGNVDENGIPEYIYNLFNKLLEKKLNEVIERKMSNVNKKMDYEEEVQDDYFIQNMIRNQHLSRENIANSKEDLRVIKASQAAIAETKNKADEFVCNRFRRTSVPDFRKYS
ncbi:CDP-alcohol phosphatidyltransferase family and Na+/H+ exchanger family and Cation/H+ exchanger domain-containing protein [Strongyloides ratti]|uniref:Sodium/hydrogen exchanger n=1 Tax=Strongyloides ratti TaxID=34506 RepID=A0A090LCZ4_STRRB|nr:CDP-alcohol phosphatidyltransferase family and Na+/H+ exchanger family and Cation/H+ exchanger domain-containing protein [Strongyloides ratti]CEF67646.1 CDP-alcohol phosphatidyltransferase family and Na+/H+ exchanger family and Cation/H+ exchanger domain-containing protein [Strongyloides ratti]